MKGGEPTYKAALPPRIDPTAKGPAPDPLGAYDAIIVGDVRPEDLNAEAWHGWNGTPTCAAGRSCWPSGPRSLAALSSQETARKLLPVIDLRAVPVDAPQARPRPARPAARRRRSSPPRRRRSTASR